MKTKLLRKWRKNLVIRLEPGIFENEEDKYILQDWSKHKNGEIVIFGELKECLSWQHSILKSKINEYEEKIFNNIYKKMN